MAKTRDILIHVSVDTAIRNRKCHRNSEHRVSAGEAFLLVRERQTLGSKNYCKQCAQDILSAAKLKLDVIGERIA
jgi:hypothetical protein